MNRRHTANPQFSRITNGLRQAKPMVRAVGTSQTARTPVSVSMSNNWRRIGLGDLRPTPSATRIQAPAKRTENIAATYAAKSPITQTGTTAVHLAMARQVSGCMYELYTSNAGQNAPPPPPPKPPPEKPPPLENPPPVQPEPVELERGAETNTSCAWLDM